MRRRAVGSVVVAMLVVGLVAGCGSDDTEVPTGPGVSRAQPTGTVNTTVPATEPPASDEG